MSLSTKARSNLANTVKSHGKDHPKTHTARRDFEAAKLQEHVERIVAGWPPLTDQQVDRIVALLRAVGGAA